VLDAPTVAKLERFQARWDRLGPGLASAHAGGADAEPAAAERLRHAIAGAFLVGLDDGKRALFEFLPLAWLRFYRRTVRGSRV